MNRDVYSEGCGKVRTPQNRYSRAASSRTPMRDGPEYPGLFGRFRLPRSRKSIAQHLRGFELHLVSGGDLDFLTSAGVAALAGFSSFALKDAQPAYVRFALSSDGAGDLVDQAIIDRFRRCFRASGSICDGGDQVALGHQDNSFLLDWKRLFAVPCGEQYRSRRQT